MFFYLVVLFTVLPATELIILIKLGQTFGLANTFLLVIGTGILGAYIAKIQGFLVMQKIQEQTQKGLMPTEEMVDGAMILVGGVTLLTPGLITDILGFLLLIPISRNIIKFWLKKKFKQTLEEQSGVITIQASESKNNDASGDL